MAFPGSDQSIPIGHEKQTTTTQRHQLGTRGISQDGERIFHYAEIGATAIGGGLLCQTAVEVGGSSNVTGLAVVTAASGASTLQVIPQHASSKNTYAEGYIASETSPNVALYRIRRQIGGFDAHGDFTSGTAAEILLHPNDVLRAGMTSGTHTVGLSRNPYKSVIVAAATPTGAVVGATPMDMDASVFGWLQTWGWAMLHVDTAPVSSDAIVFTGSSAGKAIVPTTGTNEAGDQPVVAWGITPGAGADAYNRVFLRISA